MDDATAGRPCGSWLELCLFLNGSPDSFTGRLLELIAKADPGNRARLRSAFPRQAAAWEAWQEIAPCTWGELEAATAERIRERPGTGSGEVTLDLSDPDALHVLTIALEDYAARERDMAAHEVGSEFRERWAGLADRMRAQAEAGS
jgi:hypothetical protein